MANNGGKTQEGLPQNLRKQLAVAVRSVQWSYAIFWSLSTTQQGVLEWGEGYYNGDIKTRKTIEAVELKPDKIALQRSEQLRDLYESLLESKTDQPKRPCAALSPEDLTDAEWYYLVCMSFVFTPGQGLPGRALASGETIWLCNAQYADSKIFSRSLLAKSASIQTVICFPHLGGVVELGVTELVPEDLSLLQHIKASLLDFSKPLCTADISSPPHKADEDDNNTLVKVDHEMVNTLSLDNISSPAEETKYNQKEVIMDSPDECSNGCEHNHQTEDSFMLEGASQVQSWHFVDDDHSNCFQDSLNSGDCISEALANGEKKPCRVHLKEIREGTHTKMSELDLDASEEYLHYKRTLSTILKSSNGLIENSCFRSCEYKKSCFVSWRKLDNQRSRLQTDQIILKKILFAVPFMHGSFSLMPDKENGREDLLKKIGTYHVLSDNKGENTKFMVLRSMLPSINELEARVEELESCMDSVDFETRPRRNHNHLEIVEQISDNCDFQKTDDNSKKQLLNKRKASDIDEHDMVILSKDGTQSSPNVKVCIKEQEVIIEMECTYREYLLLDIMDAMNNLHLDAHTVQSSTQDGILSLTLKSKFRGAAVAPAGMIKQALWKIASEF
ncbi:hypothetical protein ACFE04_026337 [Oxalis oulophora]